MRLVHTLMTLTLVLTLAELCQGDCTFPSRLTRRSRWETQTKQERRRTHAFYKFHPGKLEVRDYSSEEKRMISYSCEEQRAGENTFVLRLDHSDDALVTERFVCMQFVFRSEQVIQRKVSRVQAHPTDDICNDLDLDDWPLVWPEMDGQYSKCPFEGGFRIDLREYIIDEPVCQSAKLKPRLESECINGEGITINFRHFECKGKLGMDLIQKLACLASWEDGEFVFTILTDQDDLWPKLWLMRLPRATPTRSQPLRGVLSMDLVADLGEYYASDGRVPLERVYEVVMTMELYPSLCENEAAACEDMCGGSNEMFCQKECGICEPSMELNMGHFDEETQGQWQEIHDEGVRDITVTESMLYTADLLPFQCYELHTDLWYEGNGRKAMVSVFKNGCRPRFTCAEFQAKSPHVLSYRLSQSLVWRATLQVNAADVCGDDRFQKDPEPLFDKYRSQESKLLVKKTPSRQTVPCELDMTMGLTGLARDGKRLLGVFWNAVIGYEGQSHSILHETCPDDGDIGEPHSSRTLRCLASYRPTNESQFIIVEEEGNEENVECWIIHSYPWEPRQRAIVLSPSHCSVDMPLRVDFANNLHYLAKYEVLELDQDVMDPCSKWKSTRPMPPTSPRVTLSGPTAGPIIESSFSAHTGVPDRSVELGDSLKVKAAGFSSGQASVRMKIWVVAALLCLVMTVY